MTTNPRVTDTERTRRFRTVDKVVAIVVVVSLILVVVIALALVLTGGSSSAPAGRAPYLSSDFRAYDKCRAKYGDYSTRCTPPWVVPSGGPASVR